MQSSNHISRKKPPSRSNGLVSDTLNFLLHKPEQATLIKFASAEERDNYNQRVMQRIGIDPNRYSVLNLHKIGVEAPVSYVFNELISWSGDSTCWPNHIARVDRIGNDLERIRILPFGWKKYPFKFMKSFLGLQLIPLFKLNAIRIKKVPDAFDFDNARYLLYECTGGYPIGIFTMYVRSSIPEMGETAHSQLIVAVGFNFYGKEDWQKRRLGINKIWEMIHNRVTANVLNRMKQLCEWRIEIIERNK
ncbi:MAG: hypothetical protein K9H64_03820 [Bacteroidales bacterium]|nr:hypothetical protein [Bacteroidales bacterium]MCF8454961.1 hypothetical protein [Bacteroidales bacterium]